MPEINHIALAKSSGARIFQVARPSFGFFSAVKTIGLSRNRPIVEEREHVLPEEDALIARAFEETRNGLAPDVVLAMPSLRKKFLGEARKMGVGACNRAIAKRLLAYRKCKSLGIVLESSTQEAEINAHPYLSAAEMAYVQTSYRFDCSVDDLLVCEESPGRSAPGL